MASENYRSRRPVETERIPQQRNRTRMETRERQTRRRTAESNQRQRTQVVREERSVQPRRTSTRRLDAIRKRRLKNRRMILGMSAVAFLFCLVLGVQMFQKYSTLRELRAQEQKLQEQYQEEIELTQELKDKEAYVKTDEYVEEMARRLGLLYPNEIIFKADK